MTAMSSGIDLAYGLAGEHFVEGDVNRVVICSDGLDRGDPAVLAKAVEQLSRLCYRLVWVNPHVGDATEYEPTTLGMMVAAPYIDAIVSGHNLGSLEEFVTTLPTLSQQP